MNKWVILWDDSEYKTRFTVSNRIGRRRREENSDMDTDTDSSMPELVGPSPEEGYRDEDIFDESMIRASTNTKSQITFNINTAIAFKKK